MQLTVLCSPPLGSSSYKYKKVKKEGPTDLRTNHPFLFKDNEYDYEVDKGGVKGKDKVTLQVLATNNPRFKWSWATAEYLCGCRKSRIILIR